MLKVKHKGNFEKTIKYLGEVSKPVKIKQLEKYGEEGVQALMNATPIDTGLTALSWYYTITDRNGVITISFNNSNVQKEWANIAILLQYGHATGGGGWVEGRDYINPAIQPIFDKIAENAWKEVTKV